LRRITNSPGFDTHPVYSPDGEVVRLTHNKWEDGTPTRALIR